MKFNYDHIRAPGYLDEVTVRSTIQAALWSWEQGDTLDLQGAKSGVRIYWSATHQQFLDNPTEIAVTYTVLSNPVYICLDPLNTWYSHLEPFTRKFWRSLSGFSLFPVIAHEIGHCHGLKHNDNPNSIMSKDGTTAFSRTKKVPSVDVRHLNSITH
jgi:Matrixin